MEPRRTVTSSRRALGDRAWIRLPPVATSGLHPKQLERPSLQFGGLRLEDGKTGDGEEGTVTFSRVAALI